MTSGMSIKVGIDQGVNLKVLRELQRRGLVELCQANELEQTWRDVTQQKKAFMLDNSRLVGPDVLAGKEVGEIERIVGEGKWADVAHIYAAYLNGCDYFVTENPDDFIRNDRRKALERLLQVRIRRTHELVEEIANS